MNTSTNLSLALALASSVATASSASGPLDHPVSIVLDDFSSGTDDQWEHVDQTDEICDGPSTFDASDYEYRLESACPIDNYSDAIIASRWQGEYDVDVNGTVRVKTRHLNFETSAFISVRAVQLGSVWGYRYRVSGDGSSMSISRVWERGTDVILTERLGPDQQFATGDEIYIEAAAVGERLSLKIWRVNDAEPELPQLVTRDPVFRLAGSLFIGVDHHHVIHDGPPAVLGATFDDVTFTPGVPGDVNDDGAVDFADLLQVLADWGACDRCPSDANGDGIVDFADITVVLANWT